MVKKRDPSKPQGGIMKATRQQRIVRKCHAPRIGDLFLPYLNGDLTGHQRDRIDSHLAGCSECRSELRLIYDLKRAWPKIRPRL